MHCTRNPRGCQPSAVQMLYNALRNSTIRSAYLLEHEGESMNWDFELVAGPYGGTTEGPAWDGQALLFTHIPGNRIMRFDPRSNTCTEFRTGTHLTNGLMFDAQGRLYGCQAGKHCIARFEPDGGVT